MQKNKIVKIIIPVIMVLIIVGIWFFENIDKEKTDLTNNTNTDFTLNVSSVELDTLTKHNLPIIIDFGADSCIPCKEMAPVLKKLNSEMQGKAIIKFVDVWKNPQAANNFPVQVIPTQIFIDANGKAYGVSDTVANQVPFQMYANKNTGEHVFTVHQGGLTEDQMRFILEDMGVK